MNGNWLWWGLKDATKLATVQDFHLLWHDMHTTFSQLGLTNLIWFLHPVTPGMRMSVRQLPVYTRAKNTSMWLVCPSIEHPSPILWRITQRSNNLTKTIVIAESGDDIDNKGNKVLDEMDMLRKYRGKAGYFLQWARWKNSKLNVLVRRAIIDNPNAPEMMNHRWAVTLDEMK